MSEIYYKLIDETPLYNWIKINNGEMNYILKDINKKVSEAKLEIYFNELYDNFLLNFGVGKKQKEVFTEMKKLAILECDLVIKKDEFLKTKIEVQKKKIENLKRNSEVGLTIEESLIYLSKWLGYKLSAKETTIKEYYTILEQYGKANKK